ncbi:Bacterial extracellular solute-binding protein [compost metagenome]
MKKINVLIVILCLSLVLFGCTSTSKNKKSNDYSNTTINIYTSYVNEQQFYQNYGNLIFEHFPGIEINLMMSSNASDLKTKFEKLKNNPPDLIISYTNEYEKLREQSYLLDLNSYVKKDMFDLDKYADSMVDAMSTDTGSLYGLSPRVNIFGLFYNKNLFDQLNINYPMSGMDWYELLEIASRFEGNTVGLESAFSAPNNLLMEIANTNKWTFIDSQNDSISFQKQDWTKAIQQLVDLYHKQTVSGIGNDLFFQGKAALFTGSTASIDQLLGTQNISWDFIPSPVNSKNRTESHSVYFDQILSIPNESTNKDLSWEIIKMLMADEVADEYTSTPPTVSTLKNYMNQYNGVNLEEFWQQNLDTKPGILPDDLSPSFIEEFYGILEAQLQLAIDEKQTVDQTIDEIMSQTSVAFEKEKLRR